MHIVALLTDHRVLEYPLSSVQFHRRRRSNGRNQTFVFDTTNFAIHTVNHRREFLNTVRTLAGLLPPLSSLVLS